jgi:hypothetical protein
MDSIPENKNMVNLAHDWWDENKDSIFWGMMAFLGVVFISGLLRVSMIRQERTPIVQIGEAQVISDDSLYEQYMVASGLPGLVAASRNGTRYYYPWCGGLNRVKDKNKVWFVTIAAAENAGYTLAKGCDGL